MIKIEKTDVYGWETAIRGMRNPMNSCSKSDSCWTVMNPNDVELGCEPNYEYVVGENDLKLMKSLSKAGSDHGKFLRMINVTCDITAPLYWWKEYDTYKVGTVANSCSTMHKIHTKPFGLEDFSREHLLDDNPYDVDDWEYAPSKILWNVIETLNYNRELFFKTNDKKYWWQMIQLLPSSYNQKRTVQLNYQVLKSMYFARRNHKLDEWHDFCAWCETLPYFKEICIQEEGETNE